MNSNNIDLVPKHVITSQSESPCLIVPVLFDLILYVPSTIFQLNRDGFSWVENQY